MSESEPPNEPPSADEVEEQRRRTARVRTARKLLRGARSEDSVSDLYKAIAAADRVVGGRVATSGAKASESPPPQPPAGAGALAGGSGDGFGMTVRGGHREIPGYPVTDDDLENLASDTEEMRTNIGVVSFCLSLLVTIIIDGWLLATEVGPAGGAFRILGPGIALVLMVVFYLRYRHYRKQHRTRLNRIKDETRRGGQS